MTLSVFIAVTHLLGAGHLTRAAAIGRAFAATGHRVTLASGGMPAKLIATDGLQLVQLPPVRATGEDFRALCDARGRAVDDAYMAARQAALIDAFTVARPDVLITELYPFGRRILAAEFDALLATAHAVRPRPLILCSLRDILVAPLKPGRIDATHRIVAQSFDAVLVHGDPALAPLDASWPVDAALQERLIYTGYVDADTAVQAGRPGPDAPILVAGGSSAAALPLYRAALGAAALVPERTWIMLVGGGVAPDGLADLRATAPGNVRIEPARPDFRHLLAQAGLFVGLAGYNTVVDLLAAGTPSVLVPFERGRETEQRLRAERLAGADLATLLPEADLTPAALAAAVRTALAAPRPMQAAFDRDGAAATVRIVTDLIQARDRHADDMGAAHSSAPTSPALLHPSLNSSTRAMIRDTLDRLADQGATVPLWWRDDDATAHSPALDRLLDLTERLATSIAIAAIPDGVAPSLVARLATAEHTTILVHGLAHTNHAPPGEKKAEFGSHRPLALLTSEAQAARQRIVAAFGAQAEPVFVPPWNRIAPDLVAALPVCGYNAVSTFGPRAAARNPDGLALINTHLDPIDWHRGGGLVPDEVFAAMWRRWAGAGPAREPLGLLTHHLVMDAATWDFCEALVACLAAHPAVERQNIAKLRLNASTVEALTILTPGGSAR